MSGACSMRRGHEKFTEYFIKPEEESPLGRPRRRWGDNMGLMETRCGNVDWIRLAGIPANGGLL
jgi:hypothetical protein